VGEKERTEMKGINKYNRTSYGSPENNRRRFVSPPSYEAPEAKTPDFGLPGQITGDGRQSTTPPRDIVYGQTLPTPAEAAGTSPNPLAGQYPPNPTPMQGAGDNPGAGAVMPKLQVQGNISDAYGTSQSHPGMDRTAMGDKRRDQTNIDPRQGVEEAKKTLRRIYHGRTR